ncbi:hypothetical protein K445DRAFT_10780 [Daldinia sp. EC12]|nr:hypothetical protein F4774DRAFT_391754 [Daldinia eschscholtzii]OTB16483.1 hypothetical protein K445DRAFT_10780 [Daldinia sp. EC12]
MKSSGLISTLMAAALLPAAQATWCQFFYDDHCSNSASGSTNFDCANNNIFPNNGGYVKCHRTKANHQACQVHRCPDGSCTTGKTYNVLADESCINLEGAGPYYQLHIS